jgi:hypothetical protein
MPALPSLHAVLTGKGLSTTSDYVLLSPSHHPGQGHRYGSSTISAYAPSLHPIQPSGPDDFSWRGGYAKPKLAHDQVTLPSNVPHPFQARLPSCNHFDPIPAGIMISAYAPSLYPVQPSGLGDFG